MDIESVQDHRHNEFLRWVPVVGLAISFYSAIFATFVLYPWHIELSREFTNLSMQCGQA